MAWADQISFDQAMKSGKGHDVWPNAGDYEARTGRKLRAIYTHPPRREWRSLSDEEIDECFESTVLDSCDDPSKLRVLARATLTRAIEDKLREKNRG